MIITLIIISWAVVGVLSLIIAYKIEGDDVYFKDLIFGVFVGYVGFIVLIFIIFNKMKYRPIIKFKKNE